MKKILLIPILVVSLGLFVGAPAVRAASPAQNLLLAQFQLSPRTNATSVPTPPKPKIAATSSRPVPQACTPPNPPRPNRVPVASTSKC